MDMRIVHMQKLFPECTTWKDSSKVLLKNLLTTANGNDKMIKSPKAAGIEP